MKNEIQYKHKLKYFSKTDVLQIGGTLVWFVRDTPVKWFTIRLSIYKAAIVMHSLGICEI